MQLIFVIGATGAGKSTLLRAAEQRHGVGLVEVGRILRAKYPPSHFEGSAAPTKTAKEAWQILLDKVAEHRANRMRWVFIDGQPRAMEQALGCLENWPGSTYVHLYAPLEVRRARLQGRDGSDPGRLDLAMRRLEGDHVALYQVAETLRHNGADLRTYWTNDPMYTEDALLDRLLVG